MEQSVPHRWGVSRARGWGGRLHLLMVALLALSALAGAVGPRGPRAASAAEVALGPNGMPTKVYFPETGHHVGGEILTAWNKIGLMLWGYPISEPILENGRMVQYFERTRLEYWPEHAGTEWVVQGTLIGNWKTEKRRNEAAFQPQPLPVDPDTETRVFFRETRHWLANGFKKYWDQNGGVWVFGFPISEEFVEGGYVVQYFERARFEYHPEHAGTPFEVLLGLLGSDLAAARKVDTKPVTQADDAVRYDPGLLDAGWNNALHPLNGGVTGFVSADAVSIRSAPDPNAAVVDVVYHRRPVVFYGMVRGQPQDGIDAWYVVGPSMYVNAKWLDPLVVTPPPQTFSGHWVDVNLSDFWLVAYDGATPVYAAIVVAGVNDATPKGVFTIFSRVRNETMVSAEPPGHPDYYRVENVEYTQYFLDGGFALHGNWWTPEDQFGGYTSHGCVGMFNQDAAFIWDWVGYGDTVSIHF